MNNKDCIKVNDLETLGKNYLKMAVDFALKKEFQKSFEFINLGLEYLTCDCQRGTWYNNFENNKLDIFNDIENNNTNHFEYFFVKSFFLSQSEDIQELYIALYSIDKYLKINNDERGYYLKGKILNNLEKFVDANESFNKAYNISKNQRIQYRIGRLKELKLGEYGIDYLYYSFLENPSSICCVENLQIAFKNRKLKLNYPSDENQILKSFLNDSDMNFYLTYLKKFRNQLENDFSLKEINDFINILIQNEDVFINKKSNKVYFDYSNHKNLNNFYESDESDYDDDSSYMDSEYYDDSLDLDQQSPEFWDSL